MAAVNLAQAQCLCGQSRQGGLSFHPNRLPPDGKACTNPTFSPKLLYSCGLTQWQEKSWKGRESWTASCEDILKISPSNGNTQHRPFGPSQHLNPPPHPSIKKCVHERGLRVKSMNFYLQLEGWRKVPLPLKRILLLPARESDHKKGMVWGPDVHLHGALC